MLQKVSDSNTMVDKITNYDKNNCAETEEQSNSLLGLLQLHLLSFSLADGPVWT